MSSKQNEIGKNKRSQTLTQQSMQYSGPLPPSSEMNNYGRIDSSLPNRIMELAEKQTTHRIDIEKRSMDLNESEVKANISLTTKGLYLGFIIILVALICALVMILKGQYTGGIFSIIGVLTMLATTWYGVNRKK